MVFLTVLLLTFTVQGQSREINAETEFSPPHGRSIFFHETSHSESEQLTLTPRQACAVESAARANPEHYIYIMFVLRVSVAGVRVSNPRENSSRFLQSVNKYRNVRSVRVTLEKYVKGTPIEKWLKTGALATSSFLTFHTSDVTRYLTLLKYSGIYLDLDVVVAKSLSELAANWAGRESIFYVAAGAMCFSQDDLGRRIANATVYELMSSFDGDSWGNNGPGVITRVLSQLCITRTVSHMNSRRCGGFEVYPPEYFYPIGPYNWTDYFKSSALALVRDMDRNGTHIFHVWNKVSARRKLKKNHIVPYTYLAAKYCPHVFSGVYLYF